jgi:hypothetical protein
MWPTLCYNRYLTYKLKVSCLLLRTFASFIVNINLFHMKRKQVLYSPSTKKYDMFLYVKRNGQYIIFFSVVFHFADFTNRVILIFCYENYYFRIIRICLPNIIFFFILIFKCLASNFTAHEIKLNAQFSFLEKSLQTCKHFYSCIFQPKCLSKQK